MRTNRTPSIERANVRRARQEPEAPRAVRGAPTASYFRLCAAVGRAMIHRYIHCVDHCTAGWVTRVLRPGLPLSCSLHAPSRVRSRQRPRSNVGGASEMARMDAFLTGKVESSVFYQAADLFWAVTSSMPHRIPLQCTQVKDTTVHYTTVQYDERASPRHLFSPVRDRTRARVQGMLTRSVAETLVGRSDYNNQLSSLPVMLEVQSVSEHYCVELPWAHALGNSPFQGVRNLRPRPTVIAVQNSGPAFLFRTDSGPYFF